MKKSLLKLILPIALIIGLGLIISGCSSPQTNNIGYGDDNISNENIAREEPEKTQEEKTTQQIEQLIADGKYEEITTYTVPGGEEELKITLEIENGKITYLDFELLGEPKDISLNKYQASEQGLKDMLIGKDVNSVEIPDVVSGSSLTTGAFKQKFAEMIEKY